MLLTDLALSLIFSYLSERILRIEESNTYNSYINIKYGVPQCSILASLLFNIGVCDLFMWDYKYNIASYRDNNTQYF